MEKTLAEKRNEIDALKSENKQLRDNYDLILTENHRLKNQVKEQEEFIQSISSSMFRYRSTTDIN